MKVTKQVSFNDKTHASLLARIDALPTGTFSGVVREALEAYFGDGVTLTMVWQDLQAIKRQLDNGAVVERPSAIEGDGGRLGADILSGFD